MPRKTAEAKSSGERRPLSINSIINPTDRRTCTVEEIEAFPKTEIKENNFNNLDKLRKKLSETHKAISWLLKDPEMIKNDIEYAETHFPNLRTREGVVSLRTSRFGKLKPDELKPDETKNDKLKRLLHLTYKRLKQVEKKILPLRGENHVLRIPVDSRINPIDTKTYTVEEIKAFPNRGIKEEKDLGRLKKLKQKLIETQKVIDWLLLGSNQLIRRVNKAECLSLISDSPMKAYVESARASRFGKLNRGELEKLRHLTVVRLSSVRTKIGILNSKNHVRR